MSGKPLLVIGLDCLTPQLVFDAWRDATMSAASAMGPVAAAVGTTRRPSRSPSAIDRAKSIRYSALRREKLRRSRSP